MDIKTKDVDTEAIVVTVAVPHAALFVLGCIHYPVIYSKHNIIVHVHIKLNF